MDFSNALIAMKQGETLTRGVWECKDKWVTFISNWSIPTVHSMDLFPNGDRTIIFSEFLAIKEAENTISPWFPSQKDVLAEDWALVKR